MLPLSPRRSGGKSNNANKFPSALMLSNDTVLEYILADIPFFSVGLLAFGVFTFFFVMRRINTLTIYIHLSTFLAFLASIFDLSQILHRGVAETARGDGLDTVAPLIVARELGFAFSIGMRFLFFWMFVAEPPRGELPPLPIPDDRRPNFITLYSNDRVHSGSWTRWGLLGALLKWGLLIMTIAVPVLQAIWRIATEFTKFGPVYNVEGSLQIVLSSLFIIKILANIWLTTLTPWYTVLRDYSPVIFALGISLGLGIGNLLCFEFSESALGRFIQAVELYILILFVLVAAFYKIPVRASVVMGLVQRRLDAAGLQENTRFSIAGRPSTGGLGAANQYTRPPITTRQSTASRISSWLMSRRLSERVGRDQEAAWDQEDDAELGQSNGRKSLRESSLYNVAMEQDEKSLRKDPTLSSVAPTDSQDNMDATPSNPNATSVSTNVPRVPVPPVTVETPPSSSQLPVARASSEFGNNRETLASYYQLSDARLQPSPKIVVTDRSGNEENRQSQVSSVSPIFGLNGIVRGADQQMGKEDRERLPRESTQSFGMESLLRQQNDLDRSIAGLRMFSPEPTPRNTLSRQMTESVRSDFSLSNFPEPPVFSKSIIDSIPTTPTPESLGDGSKIAEASKRAKDNGNSFIVDDIPFQLVKPRMPAAAQEEQAFPSDGRASEDTDANGRVQRLDSQGTQYDVTSFIGNLTTPKHRRDISLSQVSENDGGESSATIVDSRNQAPAILGRAVAVDRSTISSDTESQPSTVYLTVPGKSLLDAGSRTGPASARSNALTKSKAGSTKQRPPISNPRMRTPSVVIDDRRTFVRPRPPPLVLTNEQGKQSTKTRGFF